MEDLLVFDFMEIKSGKGVYRVEFDETSFTKAGPFLDGEVHIIIDSNFETNMYNIISMQIFECRS